MPKLVGEELYAHTDPLREFVGTPDYVAWVKEHNLKGINIFTVMPANEDSWQKQEVRFMDELMAFRIKLYFGDYLPLTKAAIETWPMHMEFFKAVTGSDKVFETCAEAVAFTLSDFDASMQLFEYLILAIYKSFSKPILLDIYRW